MNDAQPADAVRDALAQVIANERREWRRERELIEAQARETVAELRSKIVELERELRDMVETRIASIKDGIDGKDGVDGRDGLSVKEFIRDERGHLIVSMSNGDTHDLGRIVGSDGKDGVDGKDGEAGPKGERGADGIAPSAEEVANAIRDDLAEIAKEVAVNAAESLPRPKDGKDADPEVVRQMVIDAIAEIPAPKNGIDGALGEPGPKGEKGDPGAGIENIDLELIEGGATAVIRFTVGDTDHAFEIPLPSGPAGKDGEPGLKGDPGPIGALPIVRDWEDRVYYEGEVVSFDGGAYQALTDTGKAPPHENWTCIVRPGRDGKDGKSFNPTGLFDGEHTYEALDVVMLNGASFVAKYDNPGECPGPGWYLLAARGKQGKPGEKGDAGIGVRGAPGSPVKRISANDNGVLVLENGDGSKVECDLYPILSKLG